MIFTLFCFINSLVSSKIGDLRLYKTELQSVLSFQKSNYLNISEVGYFHLNSLQIDDKINIISNNNNFHLFFFIVEFEGNIIFDINGKLKEFPSNHALSIEVSKNSSISFKRSSENNSTFNAFLWLIPSNICPLNSIYTFGNKRILIQANPALQTDNYTSCIFSLPLDSKDNKYSLSFGTEIERDDLWGISSLYTDNFSQADQIVSQYTTNKFYLTEGAFLVRYQIEGRLFSVKSNVKKSNLKLIFERRVISPLGKLDDNCNVFGFYACNKNFSSCEFSPSEFGQFESNCFIKQEKKRKIVIVLVTVIPVLVLAIIILIAVLCRKKMKKNYGESDQLTKSLTNNTDL